MLYDAATFAVVGTAQQEIQQHYPQDGWSNMKPEESVLGWLHRPNKTTSQ